TIALRPIRGAFVHHDRSAVCEWAIHDIRMSGHPADVGGAPEYVTVPQIEHVLGGGGHLRQVTTSGMPDSLRFAGGARRLKDEEQVLRLHRFGGAGGVLLGEEMVPPVIAAIGHRALHAIHARAAVYHHDRLDRWAILQRFVGETLEWHGGSAPESGVGRDAAH